jgi:dGTPase
MCSGCSEQPKLLRRIAIRVWKKILGRTDRFDENEVPPELETKIAETESEVLALLYEICQDVVSSFEDFQGEPRELQLVSAAYNAAKDVQQNGYLRTSLTSQLVGEFIQGVRLKVNEDLPCLSTVVVDERVLKKIEVLKRYTFESHIEAARLKTVEFRGKDIVAEIFQCIRDNPDLLPMDWRARHDGLPDNNHKLRCISDFIAGMTDRYALEFFQRLKGDPVSIFKEP